MKKSTLLMALIAVAAMGCTAPDKTVQVLRSAGYTDIVTTGYEVFGCGKDDAFHTGFTAKGPTGVPVSGVVCSGMLKGSTIRIN